MDLLSPDELSLLYKAGAIDLETLTLQTLRHIVLLQGINEMQKVVLNGLLDDVKAIAEELGMERPSTASRQRLQNWIRLAEDMTLPLVNDVVPRSDEAGSSDPSGDAVGQSRPA